MRIVFVVIAAALLAAGCQSRSAGPAPSASQQAEVSLTEFKFEPSTVTVNAGKVLFHFTNNGAVEHTVLIPELSKGTPMIRPGVDYDVELDLPAGTYDVICDVPGHKEAGMTMTLIVK